MTKFTRVNKSRQARILSKACMLMLSALIVTGTVDAAQPASIERGGWNNRYIKYRGVFEYLVGMDLQQLASDTNIDYRSKIDHLAQYGINKVRIWGIANFLDQFQSNLYPYEYDVAKAKFDLFKWDEDYWNRLDSFLKYAHRKGVIVEISIFEISGPMKYFGERANRRYPYHNSFNVQDWGTPNAEGTFVPEFFDLSYQENGITAQSLQKAIIDKFVFETLDNPNVYFEIMNEFPGKREAVLDKQVHEWQKEMARYLCSKTDKLVTVHSHGYGYGRTTAELEKSSAYYWDEPYVDGMNFHLYVYDPNRLSNLLHGHQRKGKLLINNEGRGFYSRVTKPIYPEYDLALDQQKLAEEIRASWGHATAGGYYLIYFGPVPAVGDSVWQHGAKAAQAQRLIMETLSFWELRPVMDNGDEYDNYVSSGPAQHWQVLANEGSEYLVYFWGNQQPIAVRLKRPTGMYEFNYYDTREWKTPLLTGTTDGDIPIPPASLWRADTGVVLTLKRSKN